MACGSLNFPAVLSALISRMCIAGGNTEIFGSGLIMRLFNTCYFLLRKKTDFTFFPPWKRMMS